MAKATVRLPAMLQDIAGVETIPVDADTVAGAIEQAFAHTPVLRHHLMEDGALRGHVLCLHNGRNLDRGALADAPLADGDEVVFHQAISGG